MSIASAIVAAQEKVEAAYTAVSNKGGTIPETQNLSNLPTAITSIPTASSPVLRTYNVTPTTSAQAITPPAGVDGYNLINVSAVTSSIDGNIQAANIKRGVTILGVTGEMDPFIPITISSLDITPTTSAQYITPPAGSMIDGYSPIEVAAVDSTIDANITAGNIKSGVTILGVTGTYGGGASGVYREFEIDNGALRANTTTTHVIDFTGITRIYSYQLAGAYNDNTAISGTIDMSEIVQLGDFSCIYMFHNSSITGIDLSALPTINNERACEHMCEGCSLLTTATLTSLATITALYGAANMFGYSGLTALSLPALTTISGSYGCAYMCNNCQDLISASLPLLSNVTGIRACYYMFAGCSALTSLSFPAITTTSFGTRTNQFDTMCSAIPNITLHFPSNVQSIIEGLDGYSATAPFGAVSGTVLFDLPATS